MSDLAVKAAADLRALSDDEFLRRAEQGVVLSQILGAFCSRMEASESEKDGYFRMAKAWEAAVELYADIKNICVPKPEEGK